MDQKINYSEPRIWSLFFNFRFFSRKSLSQHNLAKKITHFTIPFPSKNWLIWQTSTHSTLWKIDSRNTAENPITLQIFQQTCFWLVSEKKLQCTIFRRPKNCIIEKLGNQISIYYCLPWAESGGGPNYFLKPAPCLGLVKCFQIFHLIESFRNSTIYRILILPSITLKRWNFPGNLGFKGKTVVKFLIRSHSLSI